MSVASESGVQNLKFRFWHSFVPEQPPADGWKPMLVVGSLHYRAELDLLAIYCIVSSGYREARNPSISDWRHRFGRPLSKKSTNFKAPDSFKEKNFTGLLLCHQDDLRITEEEKFFHFESLKRLAEDAWHCLTSANVFTSKRVEIESSLKSIKQEIELESWLLAI